MDRSFSFLVVVALCFLGTAFAQDNSRCEYCVGKECGPNGVGGSCGTCPTGQSCYRGTCICDRNCDGRECGADACGTLCGECLTGQTCQDGVCVGACTPQCVRPDGSLRTCGWDRCGRNDRCGTCPEGCGYKCRDGTCECVPSCENKHCGPDGCGGTCGTCEQDAICQGDNDEFPGQCYFDCYIEMRVEVREESTERLVVGQCDVDITGPLAFSAPNQVYPGNNPGFFTVDITNGKYGDYSFTTTCAGYQVSVEVHSVSTFSQLVTLHVAFNPVMIEVRDEATQQLVPSATIAITGTGYSLNVNWISPSYTWTHGGFMTYTFITTATGYAQDTETHAVAVNTTLIVIYLGLGSIPLSVVECVSQNAVSSATISVSGMTINYPTQSSFLPPNGFTSYTFTTSSTGYLTNTQTVNVQSTTTSIVLCVNYNPIPVRVTSCSDGSLINGATVVATSSFYTSYSLTFTHSSSGTTWTPVGYQGTYSFAGSASGYISDTHSIAVSTSTTEIAFCLAREAFCGDGVCNNNEVATPNLPDSCFDCGRLRGFIALAVGQKDQLVNITVDVWAHPTNPALYLRRGETVPAAHFKTVSDSKGYFNIVSLSFDAPAGSQASGSYSRRFYFRLSGQFTDRTSGNDVITTLLPLWWNYELINSQWNGRGSLVGTNNSPSLYFFMTPPFSTSDSLIRIILSWGTLISTPSSSLPDLDLVIAGPVNSQSITQYGSGIVNFANKDLHASLEGLPYAKIITDQAQGYGPEVFDFYGAGTTSLQIGFSDEYASGAPANAYEVWVDRPNSSPNQDASFIFINDTNSFIVIYQNNGVVNQQVLFDERTGVEYAYGFFNRDQWNQVPPTATMWHIVDISLAAGGIVYNGFPGENDPTNQSEQPGCKYSYASQSFISTKVMPCGHVAARGVPGNLVYCPFTLEYPRSKRELSDN